MLELEIRLKGEGVWYMKNARLKVGCSYTSHQPGLLVVAAISRRHAVRGDYDYTLAPPPAQPLLNDARSRPRGSLYPIGALFPICFHWCALRELSTVRTLGASVLSVSSVVPVPDREIVITMVGLGVIFSHVMRSIVASSFCLPRAL